MVMVSTPAFRNKQAKVLLKVWGLQGKPVAASSLSHLSTRDGIIFWDFRKLLTELRACGVPKEYISLLQEKVLAIEL